MKNDEVESTGKEMLVVYFMPLFKYQYAGN